MALESLSHDLRTFLEHTPALGEIIAIEATAMKYGGAFAIASGTAFLAVQILQNHNKEREAPQDPGLKKAAISLIGSGALSVALGVFMQRSLPR